MRRCKYIVIKSIGKPDTKLAAKLLTPILVDMFIRNEVSRQNTKLADSSKN